MNNITFNTNNSAEIKGLLIQLNLKNYWPLFKANGYKKIYQIMGFSRQDFKKLGLKKKGHRDRLYFKLHESTVFYGGDHVQNSGIYGRVIKCTGTYVEKDDYTRGGIYATNIVMRDNICSSNVSVDNIYGSNVSVDNQTQVNSRGGTFVGGDNFGIISDNPEIGIFIGGITSEPETPILNSVMNNEQLTKIQDNYKLLYQKIDDQEKEAIKHIKKYARERKLKLQDDECLEIDTVKRLLIEEAEQKHRETETKRKQQQLANKKDINMLVSNAMNFFKD